jgi:putative DNA base modification enzyme with NMAD domain
MPRVFVYVVDRDFGFAPNPFHGICTLATCKPKIRKSAGPGDWVIGMGGTRLKATDRCVYGMRLSRKISFNDYWNAQEFRNKKPIRNGSKKMLVGDNVYFCDATSAKWRQADSHHSNEDGSTNLHNLRNDTKIDAVLISDCFYYFGRCAPLVPKEILDALHYRNGRSHRVFDFAGSGRILIGWLQENFGSSVNQVSCDPFDFDASAARYSGATNKVSR